MTNKEKAVAFLKECSSGQVQQAYDRYVANDFRHHNLYFKGDRQSLLDAMADAHKVSPNKSIEIKFVYEDGDRVIVQSLVKRVNPEELDCAVVHTFRFQNGKIAELWDLGQLVEKDSPNENGPF